MTHKDRLLKLRKNALNVFSDNFCNAQWLLGNVNSHILNLFSAIRVIRSFIMKDINLEKVKYHRFQERTRRMVREWKLLESYIQIKHS